LEQLRLLLRQGLVKLHPRLQASVSPVRLGVLRRLLVLVGCLVEVGPLVRLLRRRVQRRQALVHLVGLLQAAMRLVGVACLVGLQVGVRSSLLNRTACGR
jgi:hypothetical protein